MDAEAIVASMRSHIETLQHENTSLKKRHAMEIKQLRDEMANLQRDVVGLTSLIASSSRTRGRSGSASTGVPQRDGARGNSRSPHRPQPDSGEHSREGSMALGSVLNHPDRSPRPRSPMIPIGLSATLDPNWRVPHSVGEPGPRLPPVVLDASIQCTLLANSAASSNQGPNENGGATSTGSVPPPGPRLSTTGMSPEEIARSFDLPTLCAEADRLIKAIQILREERTPLKQKAMPSPSAGCGPSPATATTTSAVAGVATTTPRTTGPSVSGGGAMNGTSDRKPQAASAPTEMTTPLRVASNGGTPRKT